MIGTYIKLVSFIAIFSVRAIIDSIFKWILNCYKRRTRIATALGVWNWSCERRNRHNNCIYVLFAECGKYEMIGKWVASRLIELVSRIYINFISIIRLNMYLTIFVQSNSFWRKVNYPEIFRYFRFIPMSKFCKILQVSNFLRYFFAVATWIMYHI